MAQRQFNERKKSLCPAIAYWVALTTLNGRPASPISMHKALLNSGLEVTATQVIKVIIFLFFDNPSIPLAVNK